MRIIAGSARGRRLKEPKDQAIRPTTDRVKEAMFNICRGGVEGRRVLDLFGGTGQLGLEACSRGAAAVTIVDRDRAAVALIRENARRSGLAPEILRRDALTFLARCGSYDLVFLDPPYNSGLARLALEAIQRFDILLPGGIIVCETAAETDLPALSPPLGRLREYHYGKITLTTYTRETVLVQPSEARPDRDGEIPESTNTKESINYDNCDLSGQL